MNKRQRKKHDGAKRPLRLRQWRTSCGCTVTESSGNVFRDLSLSDPDRRLRDAERARRRKARVRRIRRIHDDESQV